MNSNTAISLGIALAFSLGAILPAAAATTTKPAAPKTTHFYISLKEKGAGCEVVDAKPSNKLMVGKHSFKSEADAQTALKDSKACKV